MLPLSSAVLAALGSAAGSGLLVSDAAAQVTRRNDDDDSPPPLLIVPSNAAPRVLLAGHGSHRSHSSHSSHSSHYSSSGGGGYRGGGDYSSSSSSRSTYVKPEPPPPPPKPARVSFAAFPGGQIFVDGRPVGRDATDTLVLKPGTHSVRVLNRFLGEHTATVEISDGETGVITVSW